MSASLDLNGEPPHDGEPAGNAHYLRAVTELGEQRAIVTTEPIFNERGLKLVDVGVRIDRRMYERLVEFRLRQPIDRSLSVEGAVDARALIAAAAVRLADQPLDAQLAQAVGDPLALTRPFENLPLPAPIAFKLTLMREQRAELFAHSLQAALVALYLGHTAGLDSQALGRLAAAGVLHDIGMLHIDPAWLAADRRLTIDQRRHLATHPITAMLIAREQNCYPATVLDAIVQHHERLDGSGYPGGRSADALTELGRILMLAELASGVFEKYGAHGAQRVSVIVRLNHRKFDRGHADHLLQVLARPALRAAEGTANEDAARWVQRVIEAIESWTNSRTALGAALSPGSAAAFIEMRLATLRRSLNDSGYLLDGFDQLVADLGTEAPALLELAMLGQEAQWQIENTLHATRRRWPHLSQAERVDDQVAGEWCNWLEGHIAANT